METKDLPRVIKFNPENYDMAEYPMTYDPKRHMYRHVNDLGHVVQQVDADFYLDHSRYFIVLDNGQP